MSNFAFVSQTVYAGATTPVRFDFSGYGNIGAVTWGISSFELSASASINITHAQQPLQNVVISITQSSGGINFDYIDLNVAITLTDSTDNASYAVVTVFAYIGNPNPEGIYLNYQSGINTGLASPPPNLTSLSGAPSVAAGVLAGFHFNSSDSSTALGFGASTGVAFSPFSPATKPQILPVGSGVCLVTNKNPFTTSVDVGTIAFTGAQSLSSQQLVVGSYVDCMPWGVPTAGGAISQSHKFSISCPPVSQAAVFLQSYFVEFQISDWSAVTVTPEFSYARIGASVGYDSSGEALNFTSTICMSSSYPNQNAGWGTGGGAYALSTSANYIYIGILDNA